MKKDVRGIQGMGESNVKLREVSTQAKSGTGISVASGSWDVDFFAQRYRIERFKGGKSSSRKSSIDSSSPKDRRGREA